MIWQRPAAAKKIPNATVPQPKFVNLKLLNCYNNAAIKNHLPLIYIYDILLYDINTSWTHPQQLPTPNKYLCTGHEILESSMHHPSHAREVCSRSVVHQKGRQHQCVLSIWSRYLNPSSQPGDDQPIFLAKFCIFFRDDQNICIKNHLVNNINFWQCFILFDWPLASSFDVLECSWWFFS